MKVLLVNKFHWHKGGSETYYFALAEGLRAMGHEVFFFAMQAEENEPCEQERYFVSNRDYNGPTSVASKASAAVSLVYSSEARRKFDELLREVHPDVIHLNLVHRQITLSILDAPYLKEHPVPVVFTAHDYILVCPAYLMLDSTSAVCDACLDGRFRHCVQRGCVKGSKAKSLLAAAEARFLRWHGSYKKIDRIIAPSEFMHAKLVEGGFPPQQVVCMQNFAKDEVAARAASDDDSTDREQPYLLYFGRLSKEKGIDVLVAAFLAVAPELPQDWRLVIAGEGPEREAIEAQIAASPQGGRVELVGYQRGADMQRYAERASLATASSRWRENMPYSIVEAFAAGTPVIGTRIGGIPELVQEGVTGFVAEPGDEESLAAAIRRGVKLCQDEQAYRAMQQRCRAYVLQRCSQQRYLQQLTALYEQLIEEKQAA